MNLRISLFVIAVILVLKSHAFRREEPKTDALTFGSEALWKITILEFEEGDLVDLYINLPYIRDHVNDTIWTREYTYLPTGVRAIETLKNDDIYSVGQWRINFTAKQNLTGIYYYAPKGSNNIYPSAVHEAMFTFNITVNGKSASTRLLIFSKNTAISVTKEAHFGQYEKPHIMCIAETSFPEATSFTVGTTPDERTYYNYNSYNYRHNNYEYNQTYKYEDVADYVQKYKHSNYWDSYYQRWTDSYSSKLENISSSIGIAYDWDLSYGREDPHDLFLNKSRGQFAVKCSAAAPGKKFDTSQLIIEAADTKRQEYPKIEFSVKSKTTLGLELIERRQNRFKMIYENDDVQISCIIPNDVSWDMEWVSLNDKQKELMVTEMVDRTERKFMLKLKNVKLSDTGIYMCYDKKENKTLQMSRYDRYGQRVQSPNDWKYERRANVSFDVIPVTKPFVAYRPKTVDVTESRYFTLECPYIGSPTPSYSWKFDVNPWISSLEIGSWKLMRFSSDRRTVTFSFYFAWVGDKFSCEAVNRAGSGQFRFDIYNRNNLPESKRGWQITGLVLLVIALVLICFLISLIVRTICRTIRAIYRSICSFFRWIGKCFTCCLACFDYAFVMDTNLSDDNEKLLKDKSIDNLTIAAIHSTNTTYENEAVQQSQLNDHIV